MPFAAQTTCQLPASYSNDRMPRLTAMNIRYKRPDLALELLHLGASINGRDLVSQSSNVIGHDSELIKRNKGGVGETFRSDSGTIGASTVGVIGRCVIGYLAQLKGGFSINTMLWRQNTPTHILEPCFHGSIKRLRLGCKTAWLHRRLWRKLSPASYRRRQHRRSPL